MVAILESYSLFWTHDHRQASDKQDHVYALCSLLPGYFKKARIIRVRPAFVCCRDSFPLPVRGAVN
jgi:hypothetical protein